MTTSAIKGTTAATAASATPAVGPGAGASASVSAGAAGASAYLAGLFDLGLPEVDAGSSGLRAPLNAENAEAILLLVEMAHDKATAANRAAGLLTRFGSAEAAIQALAATQNDLESAKAKLATDTKAQTADTAAQTSLKGEYDDATTDVATINGQIQDAKDAGQDTSALESSLTDATARQTSLGQRYDTASAAVTADAAAVDADGTRIAVDQDAVGRLQAVVTLSQIATGLRADILSEAGADGVRTLRRERAYDDVAGTAKHFRDGQVDDARRDGAERARGATTRDDSRGAEMAVALAAFAAEAMATIQALKSSLPPAVAPTAAVESGGRVRLSL